jgi:hypothetical protein
VSDQKLGGELARREKTGIFSRRSLDHWKTAFTAAFELTWASHFVDLSLTIN